MLLFKISLLDAAIYRMIMPSMSAQDLPPIVIYFNSETKSGYSVDLTKPVVWYDSSSESTMRRAAEFVKEAIEKMTGKKIPIKCDRDISRGIILLTISGAPKEIKNNPEIVKALASNGRDTYNNREAYYIKTEANRVIVIANSPAGIIAGIVQLMESAGYEILGMGPNWIYAPDFKQNHWFSMSQKQAGQDFTTDLSGQPADRVMVWGQSWKNRHIRMMKQLT